MPPPAAHTGAPTLPRCLAAPFPFAPFLLPPLDSPSLTPPPTAVPALRREDFQALLQGRAVDLYTLRNAAGACARICNLGARLQQVLVPDRQGRLGDVLLGYRRLDDVLQDGSWQGAFVGRYANRIAGARLALDGERFTLPANDGANLLHGGAAGCARQVFDVLEVSDTRLALAYRFHSTADGFPGDMDLRLDYTLGEDNTLAIAWQARALERSTVASFTSHGYFNLSAQGGATVLDHLLQMDADAVLEVDAAQLPTGRLLPVAGTAFEFRQPRALGDDGWRSHPGFDGPAQYDHYWVRPTAHGANDAHPAPAGGTLARMAIVRHPASGRSLQVWSTEPGLQVYAGHALHHNPLADKQGLRLPRHGGLCLEPSRYPDAPNQPGFPSARVAAGEVYAGRIEYRFGTGA